MIVAAIAGYLIGSFPSAKIIGRRHGINPLTRGDGNPGWWNMRGLVGDRAAAFVLIADVLKGAFAGVIGTLLWGPWWTAYVAVLFAMVGHAFPAFARFRGGRSVLTFVGGLAVISPAPAFLAIGIGVLIGIVFRRFVFGARTAMFAFPFVQALFDPRAHVAVTGVLMTFIGLRFLFARTPDRATSEPVATSFG